MTTVRQRVERFLYTGTVNGTSLLTEVPHIGGYLAQRAGRALRIAGRGVTIDDLWSGTRRRVRAEEFLKKFVQNDRGNQCVSTRIADSTRKTYHTGDLNEPGYEAFATLLNYARRRVHPTSAYPALPYRLPVRSDASKACGCHTLRQCDESSTCARSDNGRACVPLVHNARGFASIRAHTNQRENSANAARVRRASRIPITAAHRTDPDARRDLRNRRSRVLTYSQRGRTLWRRPGSRVRVV